MVESEVLGPPANVIITPTRPDRVSVSWDAVPGALRYYVDIGTSAAGPFAFLGSARDTELQVAHLTSGTDYCFIVRTEDGTGPGGASAPVCSMTASLPAAPSNVVAGRPDPTYADVSWNAVSGAIKYYVYQATAASGPFTFNTTVVAPETAVNVRDLTAGQTYCFRIAAETSVGVSAQSTSACTGSIAPPTNVTATRLTATRIRVDWTPVASGATKYYIYETRAGGTRTLRGTVLASAAPAFTAANLSTGVEYCYQLRTQGSPGTNISGYSTPPACMTP